MFSFRINKTWLEITLFAIASIVLYQFSMGIFFFLIPLQILIVKRGYDAFLYASVLTFIAVITVKLIRLGVSNLTAEVKPLMLLEILVLVSLLGGLILLNTNFKKLTFNSTLIKILSITGVFGILSVPFILYYRNNVQFIKFMDMVFNSISEYLKQMFGSNNTGTEAIFEKYINPKSLKETTTQIFYKSYIFDYFALIGFSWWVGTTSSVRAATMLGTYNGETNIPRVANFKLPEYYLWPLIINFALVLIDFKINLSAIGYIAWNIFLILVLLYAIQGIAIINFLFKYFRVNIGFRFIVFFTLAILLFTPKINILILILIPGLGISEIWIKYREFERREREQ